MIEQIKKLFRDWDGAIISFFAICLLIGGSRSLGWFQTWELLAFDWFYNLRTPEQTDERIIIVGINDADINSLSSYPVSDAILADLIKKISQQNPRIIGLDLIRNFPVPPGNEEFEKVLLTTPNLVGISKVLGNESNPSIPAYDILEKQNRYTAADILRDTDGKLRRGILYPPSERLVPGLGYLLAHDYLRGKGFNRTINGDGNLKYGEVVLPRFNGNDGGYVDVDRAGYQILVNWRGKPGTFKTVSLTEVRSGTIAPDLFKDKIVLIGVTSKTVRDDFLTPYTTISKNHELPTHGVEVQANFASHIISAVLDGRPTIQVLSDPLEYTWISFWIAISSGFAWYSVKKANKPELASLLTLFAVGVSIAGVSCFCYWAFVNYGYWIPTVPLWLGMPVSTAIVLLWGYITRIRNKQRELEDFLDALPVGVFICDRLGNPYYTNNAAKQILGDGLSKISTAAELKESYKLYRSGTITPQSGKEWPILKALEGQKIKSLDLEVEIDLNRRAAIEVNASPIYDENQKITYAIAAFQDIMDRKKAKEQLEAKNAELQTTKEQLEESNQELERQNTQLQEQLEKIESLSLKNALQQALLKDASQNSDSFEYQLGGTLAPDAPTYVVREADIVLYKSLIKSQFCYIFNARQMGKSSMQVKIADQLHQEGYHCVSLDLSQFITSEMTIDMFYSNLVFHIANDLEIFDFDYMDWKDSVTFLSPIGQFGDFLKNIVLQVFKDNIIIFIDEIDIILEVKSASDSFFPFIRSIYNKRATDPEYKRLTFCLLGRTTPSALIENKEKTPFNIGVPIPLLGFTKNEIKQSNLIKGIDNKSENIERVIEEILKWTGGQPFLTQKICNFIKQYIDYIPESEESSIIEKLVEDKIITNWEQNDEPEHLKTIRDKFIDNEVNPRLLLKTYSQVVDNDSIIFSEIWEHKELLMSGVVRRHEGRLTIYNLIYKKIFDRQWIEQSLQKINIKE